VVTTGRWRGCIGGLLAAIAAAAVGTAQGAMFDATASVARPEPGWVRYLNARFGLRVDLPESGFRQELLPDGHGVRLTSRDRAITIDVHANWLASILPAFAADRSIAALHEQAVAETRERGGNVTYSMRRGDFYVISGTLGASVYYERVAISPACPDVFSAIRVEYPQGIERELDRLVTRVSLSLRAMCPAPAE
jgi:hypothetical protein